MECSKDEYSALASRLAIECEVLRLIDERRFMQKNPRLGQGVERKIIKRTLEELENNS